MELIASVFGSADYTHYEIYKDGDKYYEKSIFNENPDTFIEIAEGTAAVACQPWSDECIEEHCRRYGSRFVHVISFFFYDTSYSEVYGFGKTEEEAKNDAKRKMSYFDDFDWSDD